MAMLIIEKVKIENLIADLKKDFAFFYCGKEDDPSTGLRVNRLPFKKYFTAPVQETFGKNNKGVVSTAKARDKFVLFGLNLPDLEALTQLDEIMEKPNEDFFYFQNRKQSTVIGIAGGQFDVAPGGDIILQVINDKEYKVWTPTAKGKKLVKDKKKFFKEEKNKEEKAQEKSPQTPQDESLGEWSKSMRELLLDSELLASAVEWSHNRPIWDELAGECLGCAVCTYVCPLCHCFSIEDTVGLDGTCSRCRKWDACTLPKFAGIAGGHSFRPTIKERYYNWFYHKFVRAYKEYGKSQCVGCGRCEHSCPANIDIQKVLRRILDDYKNNHE